MPETPRHRAIETFLAEVDEGLGRLPEARRAAEREELAQHLDLLVTAGRARGMDEDAAARAAVDRLGRAGDIGAALDRAARRNHPAPMDYVRMFGVYAVLWAATSAAVDYALYRLAGWPLDGTARAASNAILMGAVLVYANVRSRRVQTSRNEGIDA
jgi:hypothetical protein